MHKASLNSQRLLNVLKVLSDGRPHASYELAVLSRILLTVIRYSYGWNKKEAFLTQKHFQQVTGLSRSTISAVLRRLIMANILTPLEADTYMLQKDYERWQIDQRRYRPLKDQTAHNRVADESKDKICRKQKQIAPQNTSEKSSNSNDLNELAQSLHKDIFKDIYKDISLRERLFDRLKRDFPDQDERALHSLCNRHPERVDFFLYLCETFKIDPVYVKNPIAFITSLRPISFPALPERLEHKVMEAQRQKEERTASRQRASEYYENEFAEVKQLVSSFVKNLTR